MKYPTLVKPWRQKWPPILPLFAFPPPIRKAIYTTNAIESVNSVIRKFTRKRTLDDADQELESGFEPLCHSVREPSATEWHSGVAELVPKAADTKEITGPTSVNPWLS